MDKPEFNNSESNSIKNGLQHNLISRNEELFEGKTVIKYVKRQSKFHVIKYILKNQILKKELNNNVCFAITLLYLDPKFILWHCFQTENFTKVDVCNRLLKIFQQSMVSIIFLSKNLINSL